MEKIIKKIKNRAGLTLTEMLVTVAILSLFSAAVLTGMTTALSVRRDNIMANDAEIIASMVTNFITNELRTASPIKGEDKIKIENAENGNQKVTYQSNENNYKEVTLMLNKEGQLVMEFHINDEDGNPVVKEIPVFSEAAYSDNSVKRLKITLFHLTKNEPTSDKDQPSVTVEMHIGYDVGGDTREISTADTKFTVGLMNSK